MSPDKVLSRFTRSLLLMVGMFVVFVIAFAVYVRAEKQIDRANEARYRSYVLADELRQSSDDLTRMVRSYVVTGSVIYKGHYQEILDIRDGIKPRPLAYENIYWDMVLADDLHPRPYGRAESLLGRMREAGFTETEFAKLAQAKANSDALTRTEFAAMRLIESTTPTTAANRLKATRMLYDDAYHRAKSGIMQPISEFYEMMDRRTLEAVRDAESAASIVRTIIIALGLLLVFALWNAYRALHATLGCSVDELRGHLTRLGSGELSSPIPVAQGMEDSVLAWLSGMRSNLARIDEDRKLAEARERRLNAELEQRVAQRTVQLEAANKELEEFSYSMSHDMRTPLRAIDGFSKILLVEYGAGFDEEGRRMLQVLRDNAQRMGRLIDDILHFLSIGRQKMVFVPVDIVRLVSDRFRELQAAAPARDLRIEIGQLPIAWGDSNMINEVVSNLLSNAIKFSLPEGEVLIEVGGAAGKRECTYYVKDHGVGFDMRYADKLFRVFERVHTTGKYEGSGIGLAVVKRIVTRHGGRVWAEGKVNEGATIYFSLPTKEAGHG